MGASGEGPEVCLPSSGLRLRLVQPTFDFCVRGAYALLLDAVRRAGFVFHPLCVAEQRSPERISPQGARHGWRAFFRRHTDVPSEEPAPGE
jgi:hypothetical protein